MELNKFIEHFATQLEETDPTLITAETKFRDLDEWSSLTALSIIAMVDDEYDIQLKGNDMRAAQTIGELFHIVEAKA
ncbi:MAG: acyl carrier protein [Alistipes sp.]